MEKQPDWKKVLKADPTDWLLEPDDPGIRMLLASRYYQCGRQGDAFAVLKEAQVRFPDNKSIQTLLQQLKSSKK